MGFSQETLQFQFSAQTNFQNIHLVSETQQLGQIVSLLRNWELGKQIGW